MGLVVFHIFLTTFTVMTRNHHTTQAVLFFLLLLTVRSSETINQYAAKNWQSFSRQQYFDSQGLFISVVFSMPVLFNCMMMVVSINSYCTLVITIMFNIAIINSIFLITGVMNITASVFFIITLKSSSNSFFFVPLEGQYIWYVLQTTCMHRSLWAFVGVSSK